MTPATATRRFVLSASARRHVVDSAAAFIRARYRMSAADAARLAEVPIVWKRGRGRSAFYPRGYRGQEGPHIVLRVPPGNFARWTTYARMRARLTTPREGIELPVDVLATVVLIHEYTHAVQHGVTGQPRRRFSEVETTENEIEFIRRHAPAAHARLVAPEGVRRVSRRVTVEVSTSLPGRFGPVRPGPRPSGVRAVALRLLREIWVRAQLAHASATAHPAR